MAGCHRGELNGITEEIAERVEGFADHESHAAVNRDVAICDFRKFLVEARIDCRSQAVIWPNLDLAAQVASVVP